MGKCMYTLVRDLCHEVAKVPTFEIVTRNWQQNRTITKDVSWTKEILIKYQGARILLKQKKIVEYNGLVRELPIYDDPRYEIYRSGSYVIFHAKNQVTVWWSGTTRVIIKVAPTLKNKVCGLCGNYDGKKDNDWTIGPRCKVTGQITTSKNIFGNSWFSDESKKLNKPLCYAPSCGLMPQPSCNPIANALAHEKCFILKDPNGPFKACIAKLAIEEPGKIENLFQSCVYDMCTVTHNVESARCQIAETLATHCSDGVPWRSKTFCPMQCEPYEEFKPCGVTCEPTCDSVVASSNLTDTSNETSDVCDTDECNEGCFCKEGLLRSGDKCVLPKFCGCKHGPMYYNVGDKLVNKDCTKLLTCTKPTSALTEQPISCHKEALCDIQQGIHGCHCKAGYVGDGMSCKDVVECSSKNDCDENATCKNTIGSYSCSCNTGFQGNGLKCIDKDECTNGNAKCDKDSTVCRNTVGSFACRCKKGFRKELGSSVKCKDIDECSSNRNHKCDKSSTNCMNTAGGYKCQCKDGHQRVDAKTCVDIDECDKKKDNKCAKNAVCGNNIGTYTCTCEAGYQGNGTHCQEINECQLKTDNCHRSAVCVNSPPGRYTCTCEKGLIKLGDECIRSLVQCAPGYEPTIINGISSTPCKDIDECSSQELNQCSVHAACTNKPGTYKCSCKTGFDGDGRTCTDEDECINGKADCDRNAICTNIPKSYKCTCHQGFIGNGKTCIDINECLTDQDNCGNNTDCINLEGSFKCQCSDGFSGHCDECLDINECETGLAKCHDLAKCNNGPGSYSCQCPAGYHGDGRICQDINECTLGTHQCTDSNSVCVNAAGSYECACNSGYKLKAGSANQCEDVDECSTSESGCHRDATCKNSIGSFSCQCNADYAGDGIICEKVELVCDVNAVNNSDGDCVCKAGYTGKGSRPVNGPPSCSDINECDLNLDNCDSNANCCNLPGTFLCSCKPGYQENGTTCQEYDPCDNDVCGPNSICTSSAGKYNCTCISGYEKVNSICQDMNECKNDSVCNDPLQVCINTNASFECQCKAGLSMKEDKCADIDECEAGTHDCDINAQCVNGDATTEDVLYTCVCKEGFTGNGKSCTELNKEADKCAPLCQNNQICKFEDGRGQCVCKSGFNTVLNLDDTIKACQDIKECTTLTPCDLQADCIEKEPGYDCKCKDGYTGNGKLCEDVNECSSGTDDCSINATCTNTVGSYICTCKTGFSGDGKTCTQVSSDICGCGSNGQCNPDTSCNCKFGYILTQRSTDKCQDVNECAQYNGCHKLAKCVNTVGSYTCTCPEGTQGDALTTCDVISQCTKNPGICGDNHKCIAKNDSYICGCTKPNTDPTKQCPGVTNPCSLKTCAKNAICEVNAEREAECECKAGYEGDGETCSDINECNGVACADNGKCFNTEGGFSCECDGGFTLLNNNCQDIDECKLGTHNCPDNSHCNNTAGLFQCECKDGYLLTDNGKCILKSECSSDLDCGSKGKCSPEDGREVCKCKTGYVRQDNKCVDKDECKTGDHNCHKFAICENTEGLFNCTCKAGFRGTGVFCKDIDECIEKVDGKPRCPENATCENTEGSFECKCPDGYTLQGDQCKDIDECQTGISSCDTNADCTNTDGGYECTCKEGFLGTGYTCTDIDECQTDAAICHKDALCVNRPGSNLCQCKQGYTGSGSECTQVNECSDPSNHVCSKDATCTDTPGSYICQCNDGFVGDGKTCSSTHVPCSDPSDTTSCHEDGACNTTGENNRCTCNKGYTGDGKACQNVNECTLGTHNCHVNADCLDTKGSFDCVCKSGFQGDGVTCQDIDECSNSSPCPAEFGNCTNTQGSYSCKCEQGYYFNGTTCENVNECKLETRCTHGICLDTIGSYNCICKKGFKKSDNVCIDINECDVASTCSSDATCINTVGSYKCQCPYGFSIDEGSSCIDDNECANPKACKNAVGAMCVNTRGSYECPCRDGYANISGYCTDKNECLSVEATCGKFASCVNQPGGYYCSCKPGYKKAGKDCINVDECATGTHLCKSHSKCKDMPGSYECICDAGFYQQPDGVTCEAICKPGVCLSGLTCIAGKGDIPECVSKCTGNACQIVGQVCGNDQKTYGSHSKLVIRENEYGIKIGVNYVGPCKDTCKNVICTAGKVCRINKKMAECYCPNSCTAEEKNSSPVCTDLGNTYKNMCEYKKKQCKRGTSDTIRMRKACPKRQNCILSKFDESKWSPCSVSCGSGIKTLNRTIIQPAANGGKPCPSKLQYSRKCYKTKCKNDICSRIRCSRYGEVCEIDESGEAVCRCPQCRHMPKNTVCAYLGHKKRTYFNKCKVRFQACRLNKPFAIIHKTFCEEDVPDKPVNCSMMPQFSKLTNGRGCESQLPVQVNGCSGGCGKDLGYCCRPAKTTALSVSLLCPSGSREVIKIQRVETCECDLKSKESTPNQNNV